MLTFPILTHIIKNKIKKYINILCAKIDSCDLYFLCTRNLLNKRLKPGFEYKIAV